MIAPSETRIYHCQLVSRLPGASDALRREAHEIEQASARLAARLEKLQQRSRKLTRKIYRQWSPAEIDKAAYHLEV